MIKCVIFDIGDTLVGTSFGVKRAFEEKVELKKLRALGYNLNETNYALAFRKMNKELKQFSGQKKYEETLPAHLIIKNLGLKPTKKLTAHLADAFFKCQKKHTTLEPNALEVLAFIKTKNLALGVISNAATAKAKKWLDYFEITSLFDIILISEEIGFDKSELEPFKLFLKKINQKRKDKILPEECLMIGNDPTEDIAAKRTGMKAVLYAPKQKAIKKGIKPDFVIHDLKEIKNILVKTSIRK